MNRLPRLLAYLDSEIASRDDLGIRLAAVAAVGPRVALVARQPGATIASLSALAERCVANAKPPGAQVMVSGRVDVALAAGASGVIRRRDDLALHEMRNAAQAALGKIELAFLASVHSMEEARIAVDDGANALIAGTIWPSASHPGRPGAGLELIDQTAQLGVPVYAIGGVTAERAAEARAAGAYGVAAISAIFDAKDSYQAALGMLRGER